MFDHMSSDLELTSSTTPSMTTSAMSSHINCRLASQMTRRLSYSPPVTNIKPLTRQPNRWSTVTPVVGIKLIPGRTLSTALSPHTAPSVVRGVPASVRAYIEEKAQITRCKDIHICDGSDQENDRLLKQMASSGMIKKLEARENCWLARTDPRDVARVESRTFICTRNKADVVPRGASSTGLANWMHVDELDRKLGLLLEGCMAGRTMYVIPFSMGPIGSRLSKVGVQLTDSPYVVASMRIMTRISLKVFQQIASTESIGSRQDSSVSGKIDYVRCLHSVGCPLPLRRPLVNQWPCNPDDTLVSHIPERAEIVSYGSGYGGNSLLGKKCFALRIGSILGRREGWLAEHMLILGITNPRGQKKYVAAAFPSACGKTNLAMLRPALPGFKVECVGDDIAWMRFDEATGELRAINPEAGFFGVAPGTNDRSNPNAMRTIEKNTIFTNVAETNKGDIFWEGLELPEGAEITLTDWQNRPWKTGEPKQSPAAHPNSRFCAPASQCPIIDPQWQSHEGVPISAIIFGGRRPEGVPLVYEARDWAHGVLVGASMRSEATAAAEHKGKTIMHDPFAMRPFFGYSFAHYLDHWLSFGRRRRQQHTKVALKLPKIFHVNWFRKDPENGDFLWPGFGDNVRVLDWICRRVDGEQVARETPIGLVPADGSLDLNGLQTTEEQLSELLSVPSEFWLREHELVCNYLVDQLGDEMPTEIAEQLAKLERELRCSTKTD